MWMDVIKIARIILDLIHALATLGSGLTGMDSTVMVSKIIV